MRFLGTRRAPAPWSAIWIALGLLAGYSATARAGVTVAIQPASVTVAPGDTFSVTLTVTQAGTAFNAFSTIVAFDSLALTPLPLSPLSNQIGGAMKAACSNIFHVFHAGAEADSADCSLLCSGASLTGPGDVYRLHFRASTHPQDALLTFASMKFANEGTFLHPVDSTGAIVHIGVAGAVPGLAVGGRIRLDAQPNPSRSGVLLSLVGGSAPVTIEVVDLAGRVVRRFGAVAGHVSWDGRSEAGIRQPPGVYTVVARAGPSIVARTHVAVVR